MESFFLENIFLKNKNNKINDIYNVSKIRKPTKSLPEKPKNEKNGAAIVIKIVLLKSK